MAKYEQRINEDSAGLPWSCGNLGLGFSLTAIPTRVSVQRPARRPGGCHNNGPELIAEATRKCFDERGTPTLHIEARRPRQDPVIESFHDKLRDECLHMELFTNGRYAQ